jgi:hypothetical protein
MADSTIIVDPAATPDYTLIFPTLSEAALNIDFQLGLGTLDVEIHGGADTIIENTLLFSNYTNLVRFIFMDRGDHTLFNPATASHLNGGFTVTFSFPNIHLIGYQQAGGTVIFKADGAGGATPESNILIDGGIVNQGDFLFHVTGRAGVPANMNLTLQNLVSAYNSFFRIILDSTLGHATMTQIMRHCTIVNGSTHGRVQLIRPGANDCILTRTIENNVFMVDPLDGDHPGVVEWHPPGSQVILIGGGNNAADWDMQAYEGADDINAMFGGTNYIMNQQPDFPTDRLVRYNGHLGGGDFRPLPRGPLVGRGKQTPVTTDLVGASRSATPTIGAFELDPNFFQFLGGNLDALEEGSEFAIAKRSEVVKIRCRADSDFPITANVKSLHGNEQIPIAIGEFEVFRNGGGIDKVTLSGVGGTAKVDVFAVGNL